MRLPPPIAAGKLRVKEIALAVEWLPEEWPDGIPNLKQLLVVAPLTPPILLLFTVGITSFAGQFSAWFSPCRDNRGRIPPFLRGKQHFTRDFLVVVL